MKFTVSTKRTARRVLPLIVVAPLVSGFVCGCSKAPEAPPAQELKQTFDSQIQAIQNNPNMPEAAKQQAIAGIKSQQARTTAQQ